MVIYLNVSLIANTYSDKRPQVEESEMATFIKGESSMATFIKLISQGDGEAAGRVGVGT